MPAQTDRNGLPIWRPFEERPPTHVGNPSTQRTPKVLETRREATAKATVRVMERGVEGEELEKVIGINAATVNLTPEQLKLRITEYQESEEYKASSIERE